MPALPCGESTGPPARFNAFLVAMALGLGMLDLAYTIDKLITALPPR